MEEQIVQLFPGVRLTILRTERFHSSYFTVQLLRPLCAEDASRNGLMMSVLRRGTRTLPDMAKIADALDSLYGASIEPYLRQMGETMAIGFQSYFPDDRYLPDEDRLLEKTVALCGEMLLDPATRGGLLIDEYVRSERQNLHDRVASAVNNKRGYALKRAREIMFAGEPYGVYPLGEAEEALRIRYQSLTKYYREVLQTSPIELYYCGSAEPARVENAVRRAFLAFPGGGERKLRLPEPAAGRAELRHVTEDMDVEQGNLVIGYRRCRSGDADYPAMAVFSEFFGAGPSSRLFLNVRERRSLCYFVGSSMDRFKEAMTVSAGIAFDRRQETEDAIFCELQRIVDGDIPEDELETARRSVAAEYLSCLDSQGSVCSFRLGQSLLGAGGDLRQSAAQALEVSAEAVARIASEMRPELVYFLRKGAEA